MSKDPLETGRKTPPDDHEWHGIWEALDKANKSWLITAPFHAVVTNWKAILIVGVLIVYINSEELITFLKSMMFGGLK